jgi:membrane associated rhomboid family serine protease
MTSLNNKYIIFLYYFSIIRKIIFNAEWTLLNNNNNNVLLSKKTDKYTNKIVMRFIKENLTHILYNMWSYFIYN